MPSPQMLNDISKRNGNTLDENLIIIGIKKMLCNEASACGFDNKFVKISVLIQC